MTPALPYAELCRKMISETTGSESELGPLTVATEEFFRKEFAIIKSTNGSTFAEMFSREAEIGRERLHNAINTAISWKQWLRLPLTQIEWAYQGVYGLYLEVNNGGFHQFFFNSTGKYWPHILWVLNEAGDTKGVQRFVEVLSIFPDGQPALSRKERWLQLKKLERWPWGKRKMWAHFENQSKQFYKEPFPDRELFWRLMKKQMPEVTIQWP